MFKKEMGKRIKEVYNKMGICFPRSVGNPYQAFVTNFHSFLRFAEENDGKAPVYISANSYHTFTFKKDPRNPFRKAPKNILLERLFFDIDEGTFKEKIESIRRMSKFLIKKKIAFFIIHTGGKGFHLHILLEPTLYDITLLRDSDGEILEDRENDLKTMVATVQNYFSRFITIDPTCVGDVRRLLRAPFFLYSRDGVETGRRSMPLLVKDIKKLTENNMEILQRGTFTLPKSVNYKKYNLFELFRLLKIKDIKKYAITPRTPKEKIDEEELEISDITRTFVEIVRYKYPGVYNELLSVNPDHMARYVMASVFYNLYGYNIELFEKIYVEMGTNVGYVDISNKDRRIQQVRYIFGKGADVPGYKKIKRWGLCIECGRCS